MSTTQYTIRNVPKALDARLRSISARKKHSLNQVIIDQLNESLKAPQVTSQKTNHAFDHLIGKWEPDEEFERLLAEQRVVDPKDWQ